jgi:phenylpropionate dioxygenase-like ring-hydroxylating dioxygenase large terminal subunit
MGKIRDKTRSKARSRRRKFQENAMQTGQLSLADIDALIDDRPQDGAFRISRAAVREEAIFDLEMRHIFESSWVFLGLSCQIPNPHDFFTTRIGRQPVIVSRDGAGVIRCVINSCRHRGAMVCHRAAGNAKRHTCQYHGWVYDSSGACVDVKDEKQGAYTDAFREEDHGLVQVKLGDYRGFLFGSLNPDAPDIEDYLGDVRMMLDLIVDQSPDGLEVVPGVVRYTYDGNWKLQLENGTDPYHFTSTHPSYIQILGERGKQAASGGHTSIYQNFNQKSISRGAFCFPNGHAAIWGETPSSDARPIFSRLAEITQRLGEARAKWMLYTRNLSIFPNVQFAENAALQMRIWRPLSADKTEMTTFCLAPKGEDRAARAVRIRQYEEFFNPSGLATPDDTTAYEDCQAGNATPAISFHQGYARGMAAVRRGGDEHAAELGMNPSSSIVGAFEMGDETVFHETYRTWRSLLRHGLERDLAHGVALGERA